MDSDDLINKYAYECMNGSGTVAHTAARNDVTRGGLEAFREMTS